jgi:hypothetical protein
MLLVYAQSLKEPQLPSKAGDMDKLPPSMGQNCYFVESASDLVLKKVTMSENRYVFRPCGQSASSGGLQRDGRSLGV